LCCTLFKQAFPGPGAMLAVGLEQCALTGQENGRGFALQMSLFLASCVTELMLHQALSFFARISRENGGLWQELPDKGRGISQGDFSSGRRACWVTPADHIRCHAQLRENGVGVEGAGEMSREAVAGAGVDSIKRMIKNQVMQLHRLYPGLQVEWRCIAPKTELLERESSVRFWITYAIDQLQDFVCHRLCSFRRHEGGPRFSPMRYELHELEKLPEAHGTFSIGCLENGEVITGSKKSVQVWSTPSAGSMSRLAEVEVEATCLVGLGSQTIAAGDAAGRVRVWHLRRRVLKEVVCVHPHSDPVRAVSSGGDILLTASDDGTVKQLDVLADFVPSDFFTVGVPASAILARGKNVLVGCVDGVVWELSRRLQVPTLLRRLHLGVPVRGLDADPEGPGARVLAVGGGRFGIWLDPAQRRQASPDDEAQQPAFTAKCGPSEAAVVLLPGQPKDLLQVTRAVTGELNCNCEWTPVSSKPRNAHAPRSMVRDPVDSSAVYFIADVTRGATQQPELFKLVPHCPPSVEVLLPREVLLPGQLEAEESSARVAMTGVEDMKESILPESECQRNEDSDLEEASKPPKSSSYRRLITYPISTKAYRARATGIDPERFFAHPPLFHETIPRGVILSLLVRQRVLNSSASGGAGRSSAIPEPGGKTLDCRQNTEPDILPKHFLYGDIQIPQD
ncbi:SRSF2, partial [Symbiodinium microadriaticum]